MLRWGVLGTARFGDSFVPLIRAAGQQVVAVASRSLESARECAARWGLERGVAPYEALLADRDIDVVYIPLPNALHVEWTLRAIEAGKHVLCEKPLALDPADVDRVAAAASAAGVVVSEAFAYRAHSLTATLRALVRDSAIWRAAPRRRRGRPHRPRARFRARNHRADAARGDARRFPRKRRRAGGAGGGGEIGTNATPQCITWRALQRLFTRSETIAGHCRRVSLPPEGS
ncbi:MAG TPA: Gfo/Idh/MocA family oxidoreductase [Thermoanaerobaculia bacterium]|jgi:predicted dehydrogenase